MMSFKELLFYVLLVSLVGLRSTVAEFVLAKQDTVICPDDWVQLHRGCYKFQGASRRDRISWDAAEEACREMNGELASLQSVKEKQYIEEHLGSVYRNFAWWVHLKKTDNTWEWGDGSVVDENITPWKNAGIRDRPGNECGLIDFKRSLQLSNFRCSRKKGFICEQHDSRADQSTTETTTITTTIESTTETTDEDGEDIGVSTTTEETHQTTNEEVTTKLITKMTEKTRRPKFTSKRPIPTKPTTKRPRARTNPNIAHWLEAMKEYDGCFIPGRKATVRQMVLMARRFYRNGAEYCPEVTISRLTFPETEAGETAVVQCRSGSGFATFECGEDTVCWQDEPDLSACASPKFKSLLKRIKEDQIESMIMNPNKSVEATIEESVNVTSELLAITETEDISMEDILVTSKVLTSFSHGDGHKKKKVKDKKSVKKIVRNMIKTGDNLLSKRQRKMWRKMRREDKVRSASSLMVAMETATLAMAEKIEEPAVIKQVEENVEMEIQVVDVKKLQEKKQTEIVYDADKSVGRFSIPVDNLKNSTDDNLDTIVFITHYSMAEFLDEGNKNLGSTDSTEDNSSGKRKPIHSETTIGSENKTTNQETRVTEEEEDNKLQIASYILSASIGRGADRDEGHSVKLYKPVTFSMKHTIDVKKTFTVLCSFWDISQGESQAFWSQEGCHVKNSNKTYTTCECDHLTSFAILVDVHGIEFSEVHQSALRLVTIIGCIISCVCLVAAWFTFQFCAALQGERNSIHKNLAVCLFVSEVLFVAGVSHTEHQLACSLVAVFMHYFFLTAFMWMFLEGLHIIIMLVQVFDASRSRLPFYYLSGYGLPAIVVGVSCIVFFPGYGTDKFCWLTTDRYFIWAFAGPVALILLVNAIFLTYAMTTVCRHSDYVFNAKDRGGGSPIRSWIQGALALEVLLGLTWTFGYFLLDTNTLPLAYTFTVLNSLQGLFIFIFHCLLNKKAQKEYCRIMRAPLKRSSTSASTQSTFGKRTSKSHELGYSHSRKQSLNYKQTNGYTSNDSPYYQQHEKSSFKGSTFTGYNKHDGNNVNKNQNYGETMQPNEAHGENGHALIPSDPYQNNTIGQDAV